MTRPNDVETSRPWNARSIGIAFHLVALSGLSVLQLGTTADALGDPLAIACLLGTLALLVAGLATLRHRPRPPRGLCLSLASMGLSQLPLTAAAGAWLLTTAMALVIIASAFSLVTTTRDTKDHS